MRVQRFSRLAVVSAFAIGILVGPPVAQATHADPAALPDLQMAPPTDFSIERRPHGVRWLRFETTVVNRGTGAFEVYGFNTGADADGTADGLYDYAVTQRIQDSSTSGWADHPTAATMFFQGDGHNHWHVEGLQLWQLSFSRTIDQPSDVLRTGRKIGFCFWDNYRLPGAGSAVYHPSTTSACVKTATNIVPMGLSVGWGDTYPATIAFQYVDITGLPYGDYWLTVTADPDGEFVEANESNNTTQVQIRISRKGVTVLETPPWP
ncbi:MAG: lysyl oxidase family protein [Chloroflexota bacterium]